MIFIKPDEGQIIWVPKHNKADTYSMTLILKHKLSDNEYIFDDLVDVYERNGYYVFLNMNFSKLESGEYEYRLLDMNGKSKEKGLLEVMTRLTEPISYNTENKTIVYKK